MLRQVCLANVEACLGSIPCTPQTELHHTNQTNEKKKNPKNTLSGSYFSLRDEQPLQ